MSVGRTRLVSQQPPLGRNVQPGEELKNSYLNAIEFYLNAIVWSLAMPRYFFHLNRNEEAGVDIDGLTFLDHQAAWEEATMACGEMIRTIDGHLQPGEGWQMEVTDEVGKLIYRLRFIAESFE